MMLIVPFVVIFALFLAFNLPRLYESAKDSAFRSCEETEKRQNTARTRPLLAVILLSGGVLPAWLITHSPLFSLFVLLLGSAAYIDCVTQWVPDVLIFSLSWSALCTVLPQEPDALPALAGAATMLIPVLTLNFIATLRGQPPALAFGDLYVLPALGVWLTPNSAAICLSISLTLAMLAGKYLRDVPFITVLYPVFMGGFLCGGW
ncbi:prepilin peptidase [Rahnella sikkimica]|uniref:Prepilin peptidase n=1 Tax=Rahnella sikkimica TaxID=1805933 RepID=A0A2L1UZ52_9GAMM|nr:prepilin peptidase [Rahnella sikkimica]AVF38205.1 prepilin peptidase [Rahnella sikkimica]